MKHALLVGLLVLPGVAPATEASVAQRTGRESGLPEYQAFRDEPVSDWREVNDTVGRVGGWKVYARERLAPAQPAKAPAPPPAQNASAPAETQP